MSKKLAVWISILVTVVLVFSTGVYYSQSKRAVLYEIQKRTHELLVADKRTVSDYLDHIRTVTYGLYNNPVNSSFIYHGTGKAIAEELFMRYCRNVPEVQAIRLVDADGVIRVFMRECEDLSGSPDYEPIDISAKEFIQDAEVLDRPEIIFSKFERGFLPDAVSFCPSMIRTVIPYFAGNKRAGYLVVNYWGERIGEVVNRLNSAEGHSFIVEKNMINPDRQGIFLFHRNKSYEFANQMKHDYRFQTVYGEEAFQKVIDGMEGILKLPDGDFLGYTTVFPYEGTEVSWKVCTIIDSSYAFRNLRALKLGFIIVLCLSVLLAVMTAFIFAERFFRPLGGIKKALEHYGRGDLDYEPEGEYADELEEIEVRIRQMAGSLKEQLREREAGMKRMELLDRLSSLSVLSAGVSHELSTPLNSIMLAANLMEKQFGSSRELAAVKEQAERCVQIIASMKRLSTDGYDSCVKESLSLREIMKDTVRFIRTDEKIKTVTELEDIYIDGCSTLIGQAFLNLAVNAVDAVYPEGQVIFRLFRENGKAVIEVEDNGTGMEPAKLERVFDPFFTTKSPDKGTGLGLSITYRIVTEHGGTISMDSEVGRGTKVRVEFNESSNS
jgi:signal transduction histidine kinase